jgi:hypothetical protein
MQRIYESALYRFMNIVYIASMKKLEKPSARRNHSEVMKQRKMDKSKSWIFRKFSLH